MQDQGGRDAQKAMDRVFMDGLKAGSRCAVRLRVSGLKQQHMDRAHGCH